MPEPHSVSGEQVHWENDSTYEDTECLVSVKSPASKGQLVSGLGLGFERRIDLGTEYLALAHPAGVGEISQERCAAFLTFRAECPMGRRGD